MKQVEATAIGEAAPQQEPVPTDVAETAAATGGETARYESDTLAASAADHVPDTDGEADAGANGADEIEADDEEYADEETVVVMRRPVFVTMLSVLLLAIAALAAFAVYQVTKATPAVATVNGTTISRQDYDQAVARNNGKTVLNDLITTRLVEQDAAKKHVSVTTDEVDAKLKDTKTRFGTDAQYQQALDQNNLTELQLRDRIRLNLLLTKLTADKTRVTDQEIQQEFDQNKDTTYQGKTLDQVKDTITQQLTQQKQTAASQTYVKDLCSPAKITTHMPGGATGHGCPA
ncbi:MAG: SurA N-terminal domain-containing protein [Dehalococcoidia bacterium]